MQCTQDCLSSALFTMLSNKLCLCDAPETVHASAAHAFSTLLLQVRTYQEREQATKKARKGRRKSILLFGGKQQRVGFDPEGPTKEPLREPSMGKGLESAFLANLFRAPSAGGDSPGGLVLSRGGSAVDPPLLVRGRSTGGPISRSTTQNSASFVDKINTDSSHLG